MHQIDQETAAVAQRKHASLSWCYWARVQSVDFNILKLVDLQCYLGKSSLVLRFVKGQFHEYQESTIGAAFLTQTIAVDENTVVKFEIWDTAGQERYHSLAPMYYRGAQAAIVVYDITNQVFVHALSKHLIVFL